MSNSDRIRPTGTASRGLLLLAGMLAFSLASATGGGEVLIQSPEKVSGTQIMAVNIAFDALVTESGLRSGRALPGPPLQSRDIEDYQITIEDIHHGWCVRFIPLANSTPWAPEGAVSLSVNLRPSSVWLGSREHHPADARSGACKKMDREDAPKDQHEEIPSRR